MEGDQSGWQVRRSGEDSEKTGCLSQVFRWTTGVAFIWIFFGISFIFGVRMWHNSPIHESFIPFGVIAVSAVIAFSIVLSLRVITGNELKFKVGPFEFEGLSGPVILWILSFLAVLAAFSMIGVSDSSGTSDDLEPPLHELIF